MLETRPRLPELADDPEGYVQGSEARLSGIRAGAEKQIVWAHADMRRTPFAIVYLHGFSASAGEIRPVPDMVAERLSANLFFTRLSGHGMDGSALGEATLEEWLTDVEEAFAVGRAIGDRLILMGVSTGAALGTWALSRPSSDVAAAVLLSPNYGLKAPGAFLLTAPFARQIASMVLGATRQGGARTELQRKIWTAEYPTAALLPMAKAISLARKTRVESIKVPVLFLYSPDDKVVDARRTEKAASRWGGPSKLLPVAGSDDQNAHVLTGDAYSPSTTQIVFTQICIWLKEVLRMHS